MKRLNYFFSLIGAVLLATACHADSATEEVKTMNVLDTKPVFQLKIHFFGVKNIIEVNGVSVLKTLDSDGQLTTTLPVNHWMRSGENTLAVFVMPRQPGEAFNPNGVLNVELVVTSAEPGSPAFKIADIDFKPGLLDAEQATQDSSPSGAFDASAEFAPAPQGEVSVSEVALEPVGEAYEGAYYIHRTMHIPNSLPLWAFFKSETLPDYEAMPDEPFYEARDEIFYAVYKPVQDALAAGDIDRIMPMFEERSREIDQAFYYPEGQTQAELREAFEEAINSPDMELYPLSNDDVIIRREDNGKLLSLLRGNEANAIRFKDHSINGSESYPIMLRRENGKWIITR